MNHEHFAALVAVACIAWLSTCTCFGGIEITTLIDILAGCQRVCWPNICGFFGFHRSRESWWQKRWNALGLGKWDFEPWNFGSLNFGPWVRGASNIAWAAPVWRQQPDIAEPSSTGAREGNVNPQAEARAWLLEIVGHRGVLIGTGKYAIAFLLACFIIYGFNILAKMLDEKGKTIRKHPE